jgi:CBS domain containing-hemolysin-like protein
MESIRQTQKKYCSTAIAVAIVAGLLFILANQSPVGKGLILGTVFSIVNFILIGETIPQKIGKSKNKNIFLSLVSILLRYLILAVPIILAIRFEQFNLFSAIAGIFMIQFVILVDHVITIISPSREKQL